MKPKNQKYPQGFSLIELLFTMVFLSVIVFGVIKLETSNLALSNTHNLEIQAYTLASQALEIAETLGETALGDACAAFPCEQQLNFAGDTYTFADGEELIDDLFTRTLTLTPIGVVGGAIVEQPVAPAVISAYQVTVQVSWTDSTGEHLCDATHSGCAQVKRIIYE